MSWPKLSECERFVDWSFYQNHGPLSSNRPFDVDAFLATHPEVDGAVIRFCWPNGAVDQHYATYYDGFTRNRKRVMGYGWASRYETATARMEKWKRALGDRVPKVIFSDWEDTAALDGLTPGQMTDLMKAIRDVFPSAFPGVGYGKYGRGGWLDTHVLAGAWLHEVDWWLAHWPYPPPDFSDEAHSFSELDAMLPIDNGFTPYRGRVIAIPVGQVVGWQASSRLTIVPRGTSDGGYFLKSFLARYFEASPPPPPPEPVPTVTVTHAAGAVNVVVVEA